MQAMTFNEAARHSAGIWQDYLYWQQTDKKILERINASIKDIQRESFAGLGF